jgi:hypothetical protein
MYLYMQVCNQKIHLPCWKPDHVSYELSQECRSIIPNKLLCAILCLTPRRNDLMQKITTFGRNLQRRASPVFSIYTQPLVSIIFRLRVSVGE